MMLCLVLLLGCRVLVLVTVLWSSEHLSPTRHTSLYLEIISYKLEPECKLGLEFIERAREHAVCLNIHPVIVVL